MAKNSHAENSWVYYEKNGAQLKTAYDNMTSSSQATNCFEYEDKQAG